MFARVSTFTGTSDEIDKAIREVQQNVLPRTEQLDGYKGAYFLVDRENGKSLAVTLWESEEAMRASEDAANSLRSEIADALEQERRSVDEDLRRLTAAAAYLRALLPKRRRARRQRCTPRRRRPRCSV